jgi:hypothetical protein
MLWLPFVKVVVRKQQIQKWKSTASLFFHDTVVSKFLLYYSAYLLGFGFYFRPLCLFLRVQILVNLRHHTAGMQKMCYCSLIILRIFQIKYAS